MKAGTIIRLPDGREGTVVLHSLGGYGIMWGRVAVTLDDIQDAMRGTNPLFGDAPDDYPYHAAAMLRAPFLGAEMECVGSDYEIVLAAA